MNAYDVIIMPWLTEKTMEARTTQNRLEFIVRRAATKKQIARAVETIFEVEVDSVNVRNTKHGKHASVRLAEGYDAEDAAMRLGALRGEELWVREFVHSARIITTVSCVKSPIPWCKQNATRYGRGWWGYRIGSLTCPHRTIGS